MPATTPKRKQEQQAAVVHHEQTVMTSGPIPDARTLEGYRSVRPDLPDLIIEEWLKEAEARRALAAKEAAIAEREISLKENIAENLNRLEWGRLIFGSVFVFAALGASVWLAYHDYTESAIFISSVPIVGTVILTGIKLCRRK